MDVTVVSGILTAVCVASAPSSPMDLATMREKIESYVDLGAFVVSVYFG